LPVSFVDEAPRLVANGALVKRTTCLIFLPVFLVVGCNSQQSPSSNGAPAVAADALQSAAKDPGVRAFYSANAWQAVWSKKAQ
jgi:hypothetical protein